MTRKGQAAIEFLSTYGIALLTMLAVIAALFYFGIFNPSTLRNSYCNFPSGLNCNEYVLQNANPTGLPGWAGRAPVAVVFPAGSAPYSITALVNTYGVNLSIDQVYANYDDFRASPNRPCTVLAQSGATVPWVNGANRTVYCAMPPSAYVKGQRYEGTVTVIFRQWNGLYAHNVSGRFSVVSN